MRHAWCGEAIFWRRIEMSPITHLFASWIVAAKTTNNARDCRLVTLAGVLPDVDGLGIVVDLVKNAVHHTENFDYYQRYHHWVLHGALGAVVICGGSAIFARQKEWVLLLSLVTFHLHLLCDIVGSRGPDPGDYWPIYYLAPFTGLHMVVWHGQWRLDGWQNRVITVILFLVTLWMATGIGKSPLGIFSERADRVGVEVLRGWREKLFPGMAKANIGPEKEE